MLTHSFKFRVAYADTDQMGYMYYGTYARYFELARTEALRSLGISYAEMEANGIMMPVTNYNVRYVKPALYDKLIEIVTSIEELPDRFIVFKYLVKDSDGEKLCDAETRLAFVDASSRKMLRAPEFLIKAIKEKLK